jgi:flagellar basal body L-ring protein FlgH
MPLERDVGPDQEELSMFQYNRARRIDDVVTRGLPEIRTARSDGKQEHTHRDCQSSHDSPPSFQSGPSGNHGTVPGNRWSLHHENE